MASQPHALVFPFPAQSHVTSLLQLSYCLLDRGFAVTFLNTHFNHDRLLAAAGDPTVGELGGIRFATIPDGLGPGEDRNDLGRLVEGFMEVMPACLEELIAGNSADGNSAAGEVPRFTCFIADECMAWAIDITRTAGLPSAAYFPAAAGALVGTLSIPKLIADGIIDEEGVPKQKEKFQLSPGLPSMDPPHLPWNCFSDPKARKFIFDLLSANTRAVANSPFILCNTFQELEDQLLTHFPCILPVGPLLAGNRPEKPTGSFWTPDTGCLEWLDDQPAASVVYVAFGSFTIFSQTQFQELALGLELAEKPFLWVVRPDSIAAFPAGFAERVADKGRIVGWSPQQKVLAHPSIAYFVSHCGWNSVLEGVINGIPFLCWPYFADQYLNENYICDSWRIGMRLVADEHGIISKKEIRKKLEELVRDRGIKERVLGLKEKAIRGEWSMASPPHALVFPFPAQSHVSSLLQLSYCLLDRGFAVTFLNTHFNHDRLLAAAGDPTGGELGGINFATIPDGLGPGEDRNDVGRLVEGFMEVMPACLEELIAGNSADGEVPRFTCFIADECMAWAIDITRTAGLPSAAYFPAAAGALVGTLSIPKLIADGIIDEEGVPKQKEKFQLSPGFSSSFDRVLCLSLWVELDLGGGDEWGTFSLLAVFRPVNGSDPDRVDPNSDPIPAYSDRIEVLAHPSIACFVSHCGWNSVLEGVINGIPFLCWPYFADHYLNENYICDSWQIGIRLVADEHGIISKKEIRRKVEKLVSDRRIKEIVLGLKKMAIRHLEDGGFSFENIVKFTDMMRRA
ncbi:UDP-glycosyltransferase 83A1 [Apostasia shenzhenica]|uniref:UDP-glycosyltransferase 83A1 n=1 Tax=Apostasia shenzhenica TaxID=1088818 RepID=A0A2I0A482_9ASPA|nr:UDP-glycosyltransferase 83A1 [Apostasia shenzhenica]